MQKIIDIVLMVVSSLAALIGAIFARSQTPQFA
jgi:hypothetical protein